jgi:hypothetical protein
LIVAHVVGEVGPCRGVIRDVDRMNERKMMLGDLSSQISAPTLK